MKLCSNHDDARVKAQEQANVTSKTCWMYFFSSNYWIKFNEPSKNDSIKYERFDPQEMWVWGEEEEATQSEMEKAIFNYIDSEFENRNLGTVLDPRGNRYDIRVTVTLTPHTVGEQANATAASES